MELDSHHGLFRILKILPVSQASMSSTRKLGANSVEGRCSVFPRRNSAFANPKKVR